MRGLVISHIHLRSQILLNNFYDYGPYQIIVQVNTILSQ